VVHSSPRTTSGWLRASTALVEPTDICQRPRAANTPLCAGAHGFPLCSDTGPCEPVQRLVLSRLRSAPCLRNAQQSQRLRPILRCVRKRTELQDRHQRHPQLPRGEEHSAAWRCPPFPCALGISTNSQGVQQPTHVAGCCRYARRAGGHSVRSPR